MLSFLRKLMYKKHENQKQYLGECTDKIFLDGPEGSGKTYWLCQEISKVSRNLGVDTNNFFIANAHGDFSKLFEDFLKKGYVLYILGSNTRNNVVKLSRSYNGLIVSNLELDNDGIWYSLLYEQKTAFIIDGSWIGKIDEYRKTIDFCISKIVKCEIKKGICFNIILDDFNYLIEKSEIIKTKLDNFGSLNDNLKAERSNFIPSMSKIFEILSGPRRFDLTIVISGRELSSIDFPQKKPYYYANFYYHTKSTEKGKNSVIATHSIEW